MHVISKNLTIWISNHENSRQSRHFSYPNTKENMENFGR